MVIAVCAVAVLIATLIGLLFANCPAILVETSVCLLAATICAVRRAALLQLRTTHTLCVLFFSLAVAHASCGYLMAEFTAEHTSIRSNSEAAFATALLINSVGLLAASAGYSWKLAGGDRFIRGIDTDIGRATTVFSLLAVAGTILMFLVYWHLHLFDFIASPSQWPYMRYITSDLMNGTSTDEWLVNRAMDLLTVSLPFVLFHAARRPRLPGVLLSAVGYLALMLPLRRANLIGVLLAFLMLWGIYRGHLYRFTRKIIFIAGGIYLVSQCLFLLAAFTADVAPLDVLTISSTAFPELRDLAWVNSLLHGEFLHGVTFAQALVPIPSIFSDWSNSHSLRAITTKLIGMDGSGETGGLRLTIFGEGYINFGFLGVVVAGFCWGMAVGWCEGLLQQVRHACTEFGQYVAVMCFVWVCFLLYLAGTQAAASVKIGVLLLVFVAWMGRPGAPTYQAEAMSI